MTDVKVSEKDLAVLYRKKVLDNFEEFINLTNYHRAMSIYTLREVEAITALIAVFWVEATRQEDERWIIEREEKNDKR